MITSKPRHDQPIGEIRGGKVYASKQFQRWIDDVTSQLNKALEDIEQLRQDVDSLLP